MIPLKLNHIIGTLFLGFLLVLYETHVLACISARILYIYTQTYVYTNIPMFVYTQRKHTSTNCVTTSFLPSAAQAIIVGVLVWWERESNSWCRKFLLCLYLFCPASSQVVSRSWRTSKKDLQIPCQAVTTWYYKTFAQVCSWDFPVEGIIDWKFLCVTPCSSWCTRKQENNTEGTFCVFFYNGVVSLWRIPDAYTRIVVICL